MLTRYLRLMFRDPSDVGKTRAKETPDPNTLLKNADMFLKKWENVESDKPVLSEEAVKEVRKIQEHMRKGCLSGKLWHRKLFMAAQSDYTV